MSNSKPNTNSFKSYFDISFSKILITLFLFVFTFAIPARLYDIFQEKNNINKNEDGQVAGIYTKKYYSIENDKTKQNVLENLRSIDYTNPRFSILSVSIITGSVASFLLLFFFVHEKYKQYQYSLPEL